MMPKRIRTVAGLAAVGCMLVGCGEQRSRAVSAETSDGEVRDYSQVLKNVRERSAENMNNDRLMYALESFETELGRHPTNLTELVSMGYIDEVPDAPDGLMYFFDTTNNMIRVIRTPESLVRPMDTTTDRP